MLYCHAVQSGELQIGEYRKDVLHVHMFRRHPKPSLFSKKLNEYLARSFLSWVQLRPFKFCGLLTSSFRAQHHPIVQDATIVSQI